MKGRGRRPLFIFIIIYNLDVGVRAASVIIISSSVSTVLLILCLARAVLATSTDVKPGRLGAVSALETVPLVS